MAFGSIIRKLREDRRWTQAEFGAMLGKTESWVSRLENNDYKNLKRDIKVKMAAKFEMDIIELERVLYSKGGDIEVNLQRDQLVRSMQMQWGTVNISILGTYPGKKIPSDHPALGVIIMPIVEIKDVRNIEAIYAVRVDDDSLNGRGIKKGDYLMVDPNGVVEDGKLYMINVLGRDDIRVANLYRHREGKIIAVDASNNRYQELNPDDVHVEGRVLLAGGFQHF